MNWIARIRYEHDGQSGVTSWMLTSTADPMARAAREKFPKSTHEIEHTVYAHGFAGWHVLAGNGKNGFGRALCGMEFAGGMPWYDTSLPTDPFALCPLCRDAEEKSKAMANRLKTKKKAALVSVTSIELRCPDCDERNLGTIRALGAGALRSALLESILVSPRTGSHFWTEEDLREARDEHDGKAKCSSCGDLVRIPAAAFHALGESPVKE